MRTISRKVEEKIFSLSTPLGVGSLFSHWIPQLKKKTNKHWTLTKVSYCYLKKNFPAATSPDDESRIISM